jgi:glycosyltransferase involved in cell wall biosynthesis
MVTAKNRFDCFKRSFHCYAEQTYPNKELVIVNEGPKEYQDQIAEYLKDRNDIKFVFLDGWYSLGALRNISIALCRGDIFVQWDDDDFNAPERLSVQYNYLSNHPKAKVCYLSDQLHYYFNSGYLFWEDWQQFCSNNIKRCSLIPGTIMAWRHLFHNRYPSAGQWCSAGEDSILSNKLCEDDPDNNEVILLSGFGYMQMYTYHGNNVYDVQHHLKISYNRSLDSNYLLRNRDRICKTIDHTLLSGTIKVMGRDGLAFTYEAKS